MRHRHMTLVAALIAFILSMAAVLALGPRKKVALVWRGDRGHHPGDSHYFALDRGRTRRRGVGRLRFQLAPRTSRGG